MIALVKFEKDLVIERSEAEKLGLAYEEKNKFGQRCSWGKDIEPMDSNNENVYEDEVFVKNLENGKEYYTDETMETKISEYRVYSRLADKDWVYIPRDSNMVDLDNFALNYRLPYTITKCLKSEAPTTQNLTYMLNEIEEKFNTINKNLDLFNNQQFNQKVNVHVGGGLIVTYNDLKLMEDSCTDALQNELNDGWRIIACCVQPNQRRPDYVLGRYNPDKDCCETSAKRK